MKKREMPPWLRDFYDKQIKGLAIRREQEKLQGVTYFEVTAKELCAFFLIGSIHFWCLNVPAVIGDRPCFITVVSRDNKLYYHCSKLPFWFDIITIQKELGISQESEVGA